MHSMSVRLQELTFCHLVPPMLEVSTDAQVSCSSTTVHDNRADTEEKTSECDPYLIDDFDRNDPENPLASERVRW